MTTIPLSDAKDNLEALVHSLQPGDEIVITESERPIARLVAEAQPQRKPRKPGNMVGELTIISEDDEHLEEFREYME